MLLTIATLGLFSCSDKLADDVEQPQGDNADGYVAFTISSTGGKTRAEVGNPEFDAGSPNEYAITNEQGANVVYFFDEGGLYVTTASLQLLTDAINGGESGAGNDHSAVGQEKRYQARIKNPKDNIKYCVIILNANPTALEGLSLTSGITQITHLMHSITTDGERNHDGYFTMSNTVYVDKNGVLQGPTPIEEGNICLTMEEALAKPITVHVERLAAKFQLNAGSGLTITGSGLRRGTIIYPMDNDRKRLTLTHRSAAKPESGKDVASVVSQREWNVTIDGWDVSGTEKSAYWFKRLYVENDANFIMNGANYLYPGGTIANDKENFGYYNYAYWNDAANFRSYWAVDPHYNAESKASYPEQYRCIEDTREANQRDTYKKDKNTDNENIVLHYKSYNDLINTETNEIDYRYSHENTFAYDWFGKTGSTTSFEYQGEDYKRTNTYILIGATLKLESVNENTTIYYYDTYYWTSYEELLKYMVEQVIWEYPLYIDEERTQKFDPYAEKDPFDPNSDFLIVNYFALTEKAYIKGGDGRLTISIKPEKTLYSKEGYPVTQNIIINNEGNDTPEYKASIAKLQEAIWDYGTAKCYTEGKMYYAIPIEHLAGTDTTKDPNQYTIGSYGVVRNHWYQATVNSIKNPGTPVQDPDQPIVPNDDPDVITYAAFDIVIIPWHVVNWGVDL